jgi:hypothetical protein
MRVLVLLALLVPSLAAAKYEGIRFQRTPVAIAFVFTDAGAARTAFDAVHDANAGHVYDRVAFDADVAMPVGGSEAILVGGTRVLARVPLDALRGASLGDAPLTGDGLEPALLALARSPQGRRAVIVIDGDASEAYRARAYNFRARVYTTSAGELAKLVGEIATEQAPIERTMPAREPERPLPWFWFGTGAFALAITVGVLLSRPRAAT